MSKKQYKVYEDDLSNYSLMPDNPNAGSERGQYMIETSVEKYGSGRSLVAGNDNILLAGNHASEVLGEKIGTKAVVVETEGDVVVIHKRSDLRSDSEQGRGLALADNRASDFHEYDKEVIKAWQADESLKLDDWFNKDEIEDILNFIQEDSEPTDSEPRVDKADELQEKWQVQPGDLWVIHSKAQPGRQHRVLCGDCTDKAQVERLMQGEKADMVFTDPPYGNNLGYGRGQLGERYIENDNPDFLPCLPDVIMPYIHKVAHILIWTQWRTFSLLESLFSGLKLRTVVVWDKKQPGLSGGGFSEQHEWICVFTHGDAKQNDFSGNVWSESRHTEKNRNPHPTMKPVSIITRGLQLCSQSGAIVYDPFLGSGTTLIAAEQTGRLCYGIEIHPPYVSVVLERAKDCGLIAERIS